MKRKKRFPWQPILVTLFFLLVGTLCGILLGQRVSFLEKGFVWIVTELVILLAGMYLAVFFQTVIHEAGHLVFGLMTGYRFSSFRIGGFMLLRAGGAMKLRKLTIAGTGGQCLMCPPDMKDGRLPFVLYNLGGSVLNLLIAWVCLSLWWLLPLIPVFSELMLMSGIIGFAYALVNGVPMRLGMVDNDGYNAIALGKNPQAMRAWWIQLKANEQIAKGVRMKDMPAEWFQLPDAQDMHNSVVATLGVFACNRLMDEHRFHEAAVLMDRLVVADTGIVGLHINLLNCDRIYCELIGSNRPERRMALRNRGHLNFERAMGKHPGVLRTQYCWALLADKNEAEAQKLLEAFNKVAASYPYSADMDAERELMDISRSCRAGEKC